MIIIYPVALYYNLNNLLRQKYLDQFLKDVFSVKKFFDGVNEVRAETYIN